MFRQILFTHLRWTRGLVVAMAVLTFLTPAISWWLGGVRTAYPERPGAVIAGFESVGALLMLISVFGAFMLAAYPWMMDAASKHVFALSLPIRWRDYLLMRFGAGAFTLAIPALTLLAGSLLLLSMLELPPTLRAYPGTLALRFFVASLLAYSITFALQYVAGRRAATTIGILLIVSLVAGSVLEFIGLGNVAAAVMQALLESPGPLAIFASEWKLLDV